MSNGGDGTIEQVALELSRVLRPLKDELTSDNVISFFLELGIRLTPAQAGDPALTSTLNNVAGKTTQLIQRAIELTSAIDEGSLPDVISKSLQCLSLIKDVIGSFNAMATTVNGLGIAGFDAGTFPQRLLHHLIFRYFDIVPGLNEIIEFLGILERTDFNPGSIDPSKPSFTLSNFRFDKIGNWLASPGNQLKSLYGWGSPAFDGKNLFAKLGSIIARSGLPVIYDDGVIPPKLDIVLAEATPKTDIDPRGLLILIKNKMNSTSQKYAQDDWESELNLDPTFPIDSKLVVQPNGNLSVRPPPASSGALEGDIRVKWIGRRKTPPLAFAILGQAGGSRLEVVEFGVEAGTKLSWNSVQKTASGVFNVEAHARQCKVIIKAAGADGFLAKILPACDLEADFDLGIGVNSETGVFFTGSTALEIRLPTHIAIGPIELQALILSLRTEPGKFPVSIGVDVKSSLGPLVAIVQNMGLIANFSFPPNVGNLGPLDLDLRFKPPHGVGLSLDVGIIKGGGFLSIDLDKGEYAGAMELDFVGIISLKAIAIINTKMPDGSSGFSLLIVITGDFPPIQLGFGFTLNAVGGLLGLSRTVNIEALREGVRTNAIKSVLFPQDVIANITRIVSDLKQIFPPLDEQFIVGPMAELGWGTPSIITLELGILIEIPVPRIAILGVLAAFLPAEELALLRIQVNFLGVIDFDNKYISFDASLFDSRLLIYTLTGDMAFRLSWGDNPMFVLSVGGFHPAYHDAPQDLQHMTRLGISLLGGDNPRISVLSYFAVTSNTVQFGARAELYAEAAGFNVYGFIGYDVLFQFDPFKFIASFEAGLALREGTDTIMGIHLAGQLSGIKPWNARGEASITILFFEISVSFNETWGDDATKVEPPKEDILARLTTEINDNRNWRAEIPDSNNLHVSIRKMELPPDQLVIHPMGVLTFSERLVPLGIDITKFGNKVPLNAKRFDIKATDPGIVTQNVTEQFAPANFFDKNDNEKLSSPSFDRLTSGFKVTGASSLVMPTAVNRSVDYELTYLHKKRTQRTRAGKYRLAKHVFKASTKASAAAVSTLSYARNRISVNAPVAVALVPPQYGVANVSDMRLAGPDLLAGSYTEASQKYNALIARRPQLKNQVQILAHHELNGD